MIFNKLKKIIFQAETDVVKSFNLFQDGLVELVNKISSIPYLGGNIIKGIDIKGNGQDNFINTGLGYKYSGYWVHKIYDSKGFTDIFESDTVNNNPDKVLILKSLGTMKIDLIVY